MEFKYENNKEEINVTLSKETAEVIMNYLQARMIKLEEANLRDSYCYSRIANAYYAISSKLD